MESPCVGFCSTTFGDPVCRGCKRTAQEVDTWNQLSAEERRSVWERLWQKAQHRVGDYLQVKDAALLQYKMETLGVRHHPQAPPEAWALDLLRVGCERIRRLEAYGLALTPAAAEMTLPQIYNRLTEQLLRPC